MMAAASPLLEAARLHDAMAVESVERIIVNFLLDRSDRPTRKALASTCQDLIECQIARPRGWLWYGLSGMGSSSSK